MLANRSARLRLNSECPTVSCKSVWRRSRARDLADDNGAMVKDESTQVRFLRRRLLEHVLWLLGSLFQGHPIMANDLVQAIARGALTQHGAATVILADTSHSMLGNRIDRLRDALRRLWPNVGNAALIAFSTLPVRVASPDQLPLTGGSTNLTVALQAAFSLNPSKVLVISDGEPNDAAGAWQSPTTSPA